MGTLNDGAKYGYLLKRLNDSIGIVEAEQMSFRFLSDLPSKDSIFKVELLEGGTRVPQYYSTDFMEYNGSIIKTDYYKYAVGTSSNLTYKFSTFEETSDSLLILGLEKEHFSLPVSKGKIGFRKGNIKLVESDSIKGEVKQIEITGFLLSKQVKGSINNLTIIKNDSIKINGQVFFTFIPTKPIRIDEFSDYGIYKNKAIQNPKIIK